MKKLTKAADRLACIMYKDYLDWRRAGMPKADAKEFGSAKTIHRQLLPFAFLEDVDESCRELGRADYVSIQYGYDVVQGVALSDDAIFYMGNRFKDGVVGVTNFLSQFIP